MEKIHSIAKAVETAVRVGDGATVEWLVNRSRWGMDTDPSDGSTPVVNLPDIGSSRFRVYGVEPRTPDPKPNEYPRVPY